MHIYTTSSYIIFQRTLKEREEIRYEMLGAGITSLFKFNLNRTE